MFSLSLSDGGDTLGGAGHTHSTLTPQGDGVGVVRIHANRAVGQLHGGELGLVVCAHSLTGLDEGRVQDWFLWRQT